MRYTNPRTRSLRGVPDQVLGFVHLTESVVAYL